MGRLQEEEEAAKAEILRIEEESLRQRQLWEWSEDVYKEKLKQKKEQEERERLNRLEIEVVFVLNNTHRGEVFLIFRGFPIFGRLVGSCDSSRSSEKILKLSDLGFE